MNFVKILFIAGSVFTAAHCGNVGIYDEATTNYVRVVRSGLNEWYPLNGNLSSKIGSAAGSSAGAYSAGTSRDNESNRTVCVSATALNFTNTTFGANPFTISMWVKLNSLPASINTVWQKGAASTFWNGLRLNQDNGIGFMMTYGNGSSGINVTNNFISAGTWYHLAFSYGGGAGTFYIAPYGGSLTTFGPTAGSYAQNAAALQLIPGALDACVDDLLHYNRVLTADEVKQNFLSVE